MIVADEILDPILRKQKGLPKDCPLINGGIREFSGGLDTAGGGYHETEDYKGVTCIPIALACNSTEIHTVCKGCGVAGRVLIGLEEYNRLIRRER